MKTPRTARTLVALVLGHGLNTHAVERYVNVNNPTPAAPHLTWATAATTIQAAIDAASGGDVVTVTNGVYQTGGRELFQYSGSNRVCVLKALLVQSVNGPNVTVINGSGTMRCVALVSNAVLSGFTLTNGLFPGGDYGGGGGAMGDLRLYPGRSATLTNCILTGNVSGGRGGGAYYCTLNNCILTNNSNGYNAGGYSGGGASVCDLNNCLITGNRTGSLYGGGADYSTLNNCVVSNNFAGTSGGGSARSVLNNCTVVNNVARISGGGAADYAATNCLFLGNAVTNSGAWGGGATGADPQGTPFVNCVFVDNRASAGSGGGIGGNNYYPLLYNCAFTNNSASVGGGAYHATLYDCNLVGNHATNGIGNGGGAAGSQLKRCLVLGNSAKRGGGVYGASERSVFSGNLASIAGGGIYGGGTHRYAVITNNFAQDGGGLANDTDHGDASFYSCLISGNLATNRGGAVYGTGYGGHYLTSCTIAGNYAGNEGGGIAGETLDDYPGAEYCIVSHNFAPLHPNYDTNFAFNYFTNDPTFVDPAAGNYRLSSNSPCINFVYALPNTNDVDLDGNSRVVGGGRDLGAYEFQTPASSISYFWLQQYGFPTDGSADDTDPDNDGFKNWQEWAARTSPLDATSLLKILQIIPNGDLATVTWQSVPGLFYYVERSTNLTANPAFTPVSGFVSGSWDTNITSFVDNDAIGSSPFFYRVGVSR